MKKLFSLFLASFIFCAISIAQDASTSTTKKECTPTKECAEKMGMTLEQCKAMCTKKSATAEATTTKTNASLVSLPASESKKAEKASCSIEECAKKMGMTVEECRKQCAGNASSTNTKVASAVMESSKAKPACSSKAKKSCANHKN